MKTTKFKNLALSKLEENLKIRLVNNPKRQRLFTRYVSYTRRYHLICRLQSKELSNPNGKSGPAHFLAQIDLQKIGS